jgi:hypothetical protein
MGGYSCLPSNLEFVSRSLVCLVIRSCPSFPEQAARVSPNFEPKWKEKDQSQDSDELTTTLATR